MIADILTALNKEESRLLSELKRVQSAKKAILAGSTPSVPNETAKPKKAVKSRLRAPAGALASAILAAVKGASLTNQQIRGKLKTNGYSWPHSSIALSKTLSRLKKDGKVSATTEGHEIKYSLPTS